MNFNRIMQCNNIRNVSLIIAGLCYMLVHIADDQFFADGCRAASYRRLKAQCDQLPETSSNSEDGTGGSTVVYSILRADEHNPITTSKSVEETTTIKVDDDAMTTTKTTDDKSTTSKPASDTTTLKPPNHWNPRLECYRNIMNQLYPPRRRSFLMQW